MFAGIIRWVLVLPASILAGWLAFVMVKFGSRWTLGEYFNPDGPFIGFYCAQHHRGEKGWSQEELAERACIHRTYLAGIEAAHRNPSLRSVVKLANALRVPVVALFTPRDPEQR